MTAATVELHLPISLRQFGLDESEIQLRVNEWIVLSLFTEGRVSSGKAARLLNLSRVDFLALLRSRGVAYINYTTEELSDEFAAVEALEVGARG